MAQQPHADPARPAPYPDAKAFLREGADTTHPSGYPKVKFHPVHGGITVKDAGEEANLAEPHSWFDSAELADAHRTYTEAETVRLHGYAKALKAMDDKKEPVVDESVSATEAKRAAATAAAAAEAPAKA